MKLRTSVLAVHAAASMLSKHRAKHPERLPTSYAEEGKKMNNSKTMSLLTPSLTLSLTPGLCFYS